LQEESVNFQIFGEATLWLLSRSKAIVGRLAR